MLLLTGSDDSANSRSFSQLASSPFFATGSLRASPANLVYSPLLLWLLLRLTALLHPSILMLPIIAAFVATVPT
ncbi:hypothetical protein [Hymenobacter rigui]|uniref:hypothetical protein n=1 Tax=Hymenobacter rigui TaxID=334424 RepID=UPI0011CF5FCD|nr:hypothetical protein [Hymenobacter rigui]